MPLFWTVSPEALLKFVTLLHKIIQGQDLSTGPPKFDITRNLVVGEAVQVFDAEDLREGTETNANYKLFMKDLIYNLFMPKAIQRQKRYLQRGLYKTHDTKIRDFI